MEKEGAKMPLEKLNLSARPYNALMRNGINTVEELLQMDSEEIMSIPYLGVNGREEIRSALKRAGYKKRQLPDIFW